jgi:hypothetical protein
MSGKDPQSFSRGLKRSLLFAFHMTTAFDYTGRKEKKRKQDFNFDNPQFCGTFQQVMEAQAPS